MAIHGATKEQAHKIRARARLNIAVKTGEVIKGVCKIGADCIGRIEGHHEDYDKPLDVIWFCKRHHTDHHQAGKEPAGKPLKINTWIRKQNEKKALAIKKKGKWSEFVNKALEEAK